MKNIKKYCFSTLVTKLEFLDGAQLLHHSLKRVNSKYPLIIIITDNIADKIDINDSEYNYYIGKYYKYNNNSRFADTINKFHSLSFTDYDGVFFIDADIFLLENIDFVFEELYNYDFWCMMRPRDNQNHDKIFCGDTFFVQPNPELLNYMVDNFLNCPTDEEMLLLIYPNYKNSDYKKIIFYGYFIHDSGEKKFFQFYKINPIQFCQQSNEEIKKLFISWWKLFKPDNYKALNM